MPAMQSKKERKRFHIDLFDEEQSMAEETGDGLKGNQTKQNSDAPQVSGFGGFTPNVSGTYLEPAPALSVSSTLSSGSSTVKSTLTQHQLPTPNKKSTFISSLSGLIEVDVS